MKKKEFVANNLDCRFFSDNYENNCACLKGSVDCSKCKFIKLKKGADKNEIKYKRF